MIPVMLCQSVLLLPALILFVFGYSRISQNASILAQLV